MVVPCNMLALEGMPPGRGGSGEGAPKEVEGESFLWWGPCGLLRANGKGSGKASMRDVGGIIGKSGGGGGKPGGRGRPDMGGFGTPSDAAATAAKEAAFCDSAAERMPLMEFGDSTLCGAWGVDGSRSSVGPLLLLLLSLLLLFCVGAGSCCCSGWLGISDGSAMGLETGCG